MTTFEVKVTGWESIQADTEEEALEKFELLMASGYKVSDLRWKTVKADQTEDD